MSQKLIVPASAGLCLLLDQLGKIWARSYLAPGTSVPLFPGVIQLTLTTNTGGAFSLGRGYNQALTAFVIVFVSAIVVWIFLRERSNMPPRPAERLGMGFLLGGALGNLLDRLVHGQVTDFIEFVFVSFPVFNIADICIDIGLVLIVASSLMEKRGWLHFDRVSPINEATTTSEQQ